MCGSRVRVRSSRYGSIFLLLLFDLFYSHLGQDTIFFKVPFSTGLERTLFSLGFLCFQKNRTRQNSDSRTFRFQISSLRSRLEKSDKELERASVGRVEAERYRALKSYNNPIRLPKARSYYLSAFFPYCNPSRLNIKGF